MFRVVRDDNVLMVETASLTKAMEWMIEKSSEYMPGTVQWFATDDGIIVMKCRNDFYRLREHVVQGSPL